MSGWVRYASVLFVLGLSLSPRAEAGNGIRLRAAGSPAAVPAAHSDPASRGASRGGIRLTGLGAPTGLHPIAQIGESAFCGPDLISRVCTDSVVETFRQGVRQGKASLYARFPEPLRTLSNPDYASAVFQEVRSQVSEAELASVVAEAMADLRRSVLGDGSLSLADRVALTAKLFVRNVRITPSSDDPFYASYCGPHAMGGDGGKAAAYFIPNGKNEIVFCPDTLLNAAATARLLGGDFRAQVRDVLFNTVAHEVGHGLDVGTRPELQGFYQRLAGCWFQRHPDEIQLPLRLGAAGSVFSPGVIRFVDFLGSSRFRELTADQYLAIAIAGRITGSGLSRPAAFARLQQMLGMSCRQREEAPKTHASKEFLINALIAENPQLQKFFGCPASSLASSGGLLCTFAGAQSPDRVFGGTGGRELASQATDASSVALDTGAGFGGLFGFR